MKIKKLLKKSISILSVMALATSLSANISAVKPNDDQLNSFSAPFDNHMDPLFTASHSNIAFYVGLQRLYQWADFRYYNLDGYHGACPKSYCETMNKISTLKFYTAKSSGEKNPDELHAALEEFYDELCSLKEIKNGHKFFNETEKFINKWTPRIKSEADMPERKSIPSITAWAEEACCVRLTQTEEFKAADEQAMASLKSFLGEK